MARSSYVYIYQDTATKATVAAFTVKHEALFWYERHQGERTLTLRRLPDGMGYGRTAAWLDPQTGEPLP